MALNKDDLETLTSFIDGLNALRARPAAEQRVPLLKRRGSRRFTTAHRDAPVG
jgi:hypothetical protein